jgi:hypothetical protein
MNAHGFGAGIKYRLLKMAQQHYPIPLQIGSIFNVSFVLIATLVSGLISNQQTFRNKSQPF